MMVASADVLLSTRTLGGLTRSSASADDHSFQSLCSGECALCSDENAGGLALVPIISLRAPPHPLPPCTRKNWRTPQRRFLFSRKSAWAAC